MTRKRLMVMLQEDLSFFFHHPTRKPEEAVSSSTMNELANYLANSLAHRLQQDGAQLILRLRELLQGVEEANEPLDYALGMGEAPVQELEQDHTPPGVESGECFAGWICNANPGYEEIINRYERNLREASRKVLMMRFQDLLDKLWK